MGVKEVGNNITIKSELKDIIDKTDVENPITKNWPIDNSNLIVSTSRKTTRISGTVKSWYQKEEVGRIAWNTIGIWHVNNELKVDFNYAYS